MTQLPWPSFAWALANASAPRPKPIQLAATVRPFPTKFFRAKFRALL